MANLDGITINVGISISDDTVNRCRDILSMYLTDHPELVPGVFETINNDGTKYRTLCLNKKEVSDGNQN